jgi:hypothetical protein
LEGQDHSAAGVEGPIGAASPFSPNPNNEQHTPNMNTRATMTRRVPWRRCSLLWRRSVAERLFLLDPAANTGKDYSSTLKFSPIAHYSRNPQTSSVATYHFLVCARSEASRGPYTENGPGYPWRVLRLAYEKREGVR